MPLDTPPQLYWFSGFNSSHTLWYLVSFCRVPCHMLLTERFCDKYNYYRVRGWGGTNGDTGREMIQRINNTVLLPRAIHAKKKYTIFFRKASQLIFLVLVIRHSLHCAF